MDVRNNRELGSQELLNDKRKLEHDLMLMPEEPLDDAIRRGLEQGRKRAVRTKRKRISWQTAGAMLCIFMLLTGFIRVSPAFAKMMKDIPGFGKFVELIEYDQSLQSALNHEYMQPVGASAESNGYKMTVESIMADQQRLVILYTVEGPGIDENTDFIDYKVENSNGMNLEAAIGSSHYYRSEDEAVESKLYDYLDIMLSGTAKMPESIIFGVKPGDDWLEVELSIDHERFAEMSEHIVLDKTFEVGDQSFTIKDALITPLQVMINFESDPGNELRSNLFIDIALVDEKGRKYSSNMGFNTMDAEFSRQFQSSYFERPKELTLMLEGLHMSDKGKIFVIDTDKKETLRTPLEGITLDSVKDAGDHYELKLKMSGLDDLSSTVGYTFFEHNGRFKDAAGNSYDILDRSGTQIEVTSSDGERVSNYYYNIPKADYVQPLTFEVIQYPGYVKEPISIRIK